MKTWIIKKIISAIIKAIKKKHDLKKIDDYVNKDNELDIKVISLFEKRTSDLKQINSLRKAVTKYGKYQEVIEKDIASLKKDSHKPIERLEKRLKKLEKFKKEK